MDIIDMLREINSKKENVELELICVVYPDGTKKEQVVVVDNKGHAFSPMYVEHKDGDECSKCGISKLNYQLSKQPKCLK